jgi:phage protein D
MVSFNVNLNGKQFTTEMKEFISSIKMKKISTGASSLELNINDPEMTFIGDVELFKQNVPINFSFKKEGTNEIVNFVGYVAQVSVEMSNDVPTMTITCSDESYKLDRKKKSKNWGNKKRHVIAKEIFQSYGLKTVIDESQDKPSTSDSNSSSSEVSQSNETDMSFLTKLAGEEADDWLCYVFNGTGYYCKKKLLETPKKTLEYRKGECSIKSFKPTINSVTKRVPVYEQDYDLATQSVTEVTTTKTKNKQGK